MMKKLLLALLCLLPVSAHAQSTKAQLTTEINTNLASAQPGGITALQTRTTLLDMLNSIMPTAPVTSGNYASYSGTTGLLQDSGVSQSSAVNSLDVRNYAVGPKTFSTVCNGTGDDTATIQAAANAASSNAGGTVTFPASQCILASTIDLTDKGNIVFQGQGAGRNLSSAKTLFTYTAATGSLLKLDGTIGFKSDGINFTYSSGTYSGDLIDARQVSGALNTNLITISNCYIWGVSGTANSMIRLGGSGGKATLSFRLEGCLLQGAIQNIKGDGNAIGIYLAKNYFNATTGTTSHVGLAGQNWSLVANVFEPTASTVANVVIANGLTLGAAIHGNWFGDSGSATVINLTGAVVQGLSVMGNQIQGGAFSINAGAAIGVVIEGNNLSAVNTCNIIISSAFIVTVIGNNNMGALICALPASTPYFVNLNDANNGYAISNIALGNATAHGLLIGQGATTPVSPMAVMTNGQIPVGQTGADPLPKTISGGATLSAAGVLTLTTKAFLASASLSNPTGTTSATAVMMGFGGTCKLTPVLGGNVQLTIIATLLDTTINAVQTANIRYGTSAAPANGAAATGTAVLNPTTGGQAVASVANAMTLVGNVTGLTPSTAYWFDLTLQTTAGTTNAFNATCSANEL